MAFCFRRSSLVGRAGNAHVEIRLIDLLNVAREDNFGLLSGTCYNRFNLVRGKILSLIHDEEGVAQTSSANIGQRLDNKLLFTLHLFDFVDLFSLIIELVFDDVQVVE